MHDQISSYIRFEDRAGSNQFIEYKPNSFHLRAQLEESKGNIEQALLNQLHQDFEEYQGSLSLCKVRQIYGDPTYSVLAEIDCEYSQ